VPFAEPVGRDVFALEYEYAHFRRQCTHLCGGWGRHER
jgi:hypothetical protein